MIKFFRTIRQSLLVNGQTIKYLKYAFGEIVLVVIGILIALQINNWNEAQKQNRLEKSYYCRLLEDAENDKEQIWDFLDQCKARLKSSNQALRLLQRDKTLKEEIGIEFSKTIRAIYAELKVNNTAFEDLKSGSNLNIIKDKSIIKSLNNYFNKIETNKSIIKVNAEHALQIYDTQKDLFLNGRIEGLMSLDRLKDNMDPDVFNSVPLDKTGSINNEVKSELYNDMIHILTANARQLELLGFIMNENDVLI
ncbi:MAG: hypothetical protein IPL55_03505 [Saprospiraceae bacterium]|nr:hypothetical protein [Saprospiraceae bacterium]